MEAIKHEHNEDCEYGDFIHYLVQAAPSVLWYNVQDVGSYQGSVYAVGKYKNQILIYEDGYGSCSGCGAWGEGGEPENEEDILNRSNLFSDKELAIKYIEQINGYEPPDKNEMIKAVKSIKIAT